jgi:hypothetical protein
MLYLVHIYDLCDMIEESARDSNRIPIMQQLRIYRHPALVSPS